MGSVSLKDFVAETLKAISVGVAEAQDASKRAGGIPIALFSVGQSPIEQGEQLVKFTVSLQAETNLSRDFSASGAATLISVVTGKLDASARQETMSNKLHVVEFAVPIHFNSRWPKQECD
jgi:hypothetical protein